LHEIGIWRLNNLRIALHSLYLCDNYKQDSFGKVKALYLRTWEKFLPPKFCFTVLRLIFANAPMQKNPNASYICMY